MSTVIVIGSGPAAAGATMALEPTPHEITVLDIGTTLEEEKLRTLEMLRTQSPEEWQPDNLPTNFGAPSSGMQRGLPEKRSFGSDYPYRDSGQFMGIHVDSEVNQKLVSGAYGGFSTVWGAQFMPFSDSVLREWPVPREGLVEGYKRIFERVPYAAVADDLRSQLPLYAEPLASFHVSDRAAAILRRYYEHRAQVRRRGIVLGHARTAMDQMRCTQCGLCQSGCPYSLIYSSGHTFDELRLRRRVNFRSGWKVHSVGEDEAEAYADAENVRTKERRRFRGDAVIVACGSFKSTQIIASSLKKYDGELRMKESRQFIFPMISIRAVPDPRERLQTTLGQLFLCEDESQEGADASALQIYTYDPSFVDALPRPLNHAALRKPRAELLRRLSVGIGYLPSHLSAEMAVTLGPPTRASELGSISIRECPSIVQSQRVRRFLRRMMKVAPLLDLWPLTPMMMVAAAGKSYHCGGTLPHVERPREWWQTDSLGRVPNWRHIYVVDGAVFPSIGSTTFTATVMANAYRIGAEVGTVLRQSQ